MLYKDTHVPFFAGCDDGFTVTYKATIETKGKRNCAISSLCGLSCHGIGYVFIVRVCLKRYQHLFRWRFSRFVHRLRFSSVHKDKQQFRQRFTLLCSVAAQTNFHTKKRKGFSPRTKLATKKITDIKRLSGEKKERGKNLQFFSSLCH